MKDKQKGDPNSPYCILVEGSGDEHVVYHLLNINGYDWKRRDLPTPYIRDSGGFPKLRQSIPTFAKSLKRLGIVVDADDDVDARWASLRDRAQDIGIDGLPTGPADEGWVGDVKDHFELERIGIWIMPNNRDSGMLEDFVATLVRKDDVVWPIASSATQEAIAAGAPLPPNKLTKGSLYTWLAWQKEPGRPFGTSISNRVLGHDSEVARQFVAWFRKLFE